MDEIDYEALCREMAEWMKWEYEQMMQERKEEMEA
jgi:hypothetical protein